MGLRSLAIAVLGALVTASITFTGFAACSADSFPGDIAGAIFLPSFVSSTGERLLRDAEVTAFAAESTRNAAEALASKFAANDGVDDQNNSNAAPDINAADIAPNDPKPLLLAAVLAADSSAIGVDPPHPAHQEPVASERKQKTMVVAIVRKPVGRAASRTRHSRVKLPARGNRTQRKVVAASTKRPRNEKSVKPGDGNVNIASKIFNPTFWSWPGNEKQQDD